MTESELIEAIFGVEDEEGEEHLLREVELYIRENPEARYTIATALESLAIKRSAA